MANQPNYVQPIPENPQSFSVSRIAESENDIEIIYGREPGQFGFDNDDNVEMHFYDSTNRLVGSVIIPVSSGIISARTILLPDGTREEKIVLDMTRVQNELGLLIPPGTYTTTLNLFSNEIGSYTNPSLVIEEVSPSRTELRLGFANGITDFDKQQLFEFVEPSVPRVVAAGIIGNALGIEAETVDTPNSVTKQQFISTVREQLEKDNRNLISQLTNLQPDAPDNLNSTIEFISTSIYDEFINLLETTKNAAQFDRLQKQELLTLVELAVNRALVNTNINLFTQDTVRYI